MYFGSHIGAEEGLIQAAKNIKNAGGSILQIFLTPPGTLKATKRTVDELISFKQYLDKHNMKVVVHSSYLHNLAKEWDKYSWWINNIIEEIKYCNMLGAIGIVVHLGKQLDLSQEQAYNNMYTALLYIHAQTKTNSPTHTLTPTPTHTLTHTSTPIFLETSSGQGTEMCTKLEDLAYFYRKFSKSPNHEIRDRIKICIDTCHIFSAGYDLRTKKVADLYLETFEEMIGLKHIQLIHFNDSKVPLGSRVDRHDNIGKGYIGDDGLAYLFDFFYRKLKVPIILETPNNGYRLEIKKLLHNTITE